VDDISDEQLLESYMGGLKQDIKHDLFLRHTTHIMEAMQYAHHIQAKIKATHTYKIGSYTTSIYFLGGHKTSLPRPKMLTPQQMDERREKRQCFNCDNKYNK
jgi:hypothetical protein